MTGLFWRDLAERALKTFAQAAAALFVASGTDLIDAPWLATLSASGMAALLSVLSSVASSQVGANASPSLVTAAPGETYGRHAAPE